MPDGPDRDLGITGAVSEQGRPVRPSASSTVAIAAGLAGLGGSFLTWASASTSGGAVSRSGLGEGHGKLTAIAALVIVVCTAMSHGRRIQIVVATLAAAAGLTISIYHWGYVEEEFDSAANVSAVSVGIGLYLCTFAFTICLGALLSVMSNPRPA